MNNNNKCDSMKDTDKPDTFGLLVFLMSLLCMMTVTIAIMNVRLAILIVVSLGIMAVSITIYCFKFYLMTSGKSKK